MSKFGGGGYKCTICDKTSYAAETIMYEKKPYHIECFRCSECNTKISASNAGLFEDKLFCKKCFGAGGYAQKQRNVKWTPSGSTGEPKAGLSKFGGGGVKCTVCEKTVYAAEQVNFEKKPYHADCLKCTECNLKTTPSNANLFEDRVICSKCFKEKGYAQKQTKTTKKTNTTNALASKFGGGGTKCYVCDKTVYSAEMISYEKKAFHSDCFKCLNCDKKMSPSGAEAKKEGDDIKIYCRKCWGELGLNRAQVVKQN